MRVTDVERASPPGPCSPAEALASLENDLDHVTALAERAIARAWDTGLLTFARDDHLPFASEVSGLLGLSSGKAPEPLARAGARVARSRLAFDTAAGGGLLPLAVLGPELGLSPLARRILLVVAAPNLRGELARLYRILANDPSRAVCDEHLIGRLLADDDADDVARELAGASPLCRSRAVRTAGGKRPFAALHAHPIVLHRLRAEAVSGRPFPGVIEREPDIPIADFIGPAAAIGELARTLRRPSPRPYRLLVRGRPGSGRRTLVAALADDLGRHLGTIDASALPGNRLPALGEALAATGLLGWIACVTGLDALLAAASPAERRQLAACLRDHAGPLAVCLRPETPSPLDAGHFLVELPPLAEGDRLAVWRRALGRHGVAADPERLAQRFRLGAGGIHRAAALAAGGDTANVESTVNDLLDARIADVATRIVRLPERHQVVLGAEGFARLDELVARIRHRRLVYETWGFDLVLAGARGLTVLFHGGPGTGKTLVAGLVARETGRDLFRVDLAHTVSKWLGETEKHLAQVFDAAEDGRAILLFDEADSLFGKRTDIRSSSDRYANLQVNYLLQRLDSFEGVAILTTNFVSAVDAAFSRRVSLRLEFPFPDEEMRARLWHVHLPLEVTSTYRVDIGSLARRYRLSGGYIRNAALRAAFLAADEGRAIEQEHLERAVTIEFRELGKLTDTGVLE